MTVDIRLLMMLKSLSMETFLTGQLTFTDITIEPFTGDSHPSIPENCDVSVATALDLLQPIIQTRNI